MFLTNLIFSILLSLAPEDKYIGSISLWVEPSTGSVVYRTEIDGQYFLDECHLMSFIALQGEHTCGVDQMEFWSKEIMKFQIENDSIRRF